MQLNLRFYGQLAEAANCSAIIFKCNETTFGELKTALKKKLPYLKNQSFKLAQNNKICSDTTPIENHPIDVFPPFSGG